MVQHQLHNGDSVVVDSISHDGRVALKADFPEASQQVAVQGLRRFSLIEGLWRLEVGAGLPQARIVEACADQGEAVGSCYWLRDMLSGEVSFERRERPRCIVVVVLVLRLLHGVELLRSWKSGAVELGGGLQDGLQLAA